MEPELVYGAHVRDQNNNGATHKGSAKRN